MALRQLRACVTLSASPRTVTHAWRKCLAQPLVAEAVGCTSERTATDAGCEPRGTGSARSNKGVSARRGMRTRPSRGLLQRGEVLELHGWVRRCPRRQGHICLPLKLCGARAEDPCGEGGNPTSRCASRSLFETLRHPNGCRALDKVRIEPFGSQALPDPKLAWGREWRQRGQFARGKPTLC
jgi:hypothetical protein